jgi:hypothetical protein
MIPDQSTIPAHLRDTLEPHECILGNTNSFNNNLCLHLAHALSIRAHTDLKFESAYHTSLPFGSAIVFDAVCADVQAMADGIHLVPNYSVEQEWLSLDGLKALWESEISGVVEEQQRRESFCPPVVKLDTLQFRQRIHESIYLVAIGGAEVVGSGLKARRAPSSGSRRHKETESAGAAPMESHDQSLFAFKAINFDVKHMYHDLKQLLAIGDTNPYIVNRPLYLVRQRCR